MPLVSSWCSTPAVPKVLVSTSTRFFKTNSQLVLRPIRNLSVCLRICRFASCFFCTRPFFRWHVLLFFAYKCPWPWCPLWCRATRVLNGGQQSSSKVRKHWDVKRQRWHGNRIKSNEHALFFNSTALVLSLQFRWYSCVFVMLSSFPCFTSCTLTRTLYGQAEKIHQGWFDGHTQWLSCTLSCRGRVCRTLLRKSRFVSFCVRFTEVSEFIRFVLRFGFRRRFSEVNCFRENLWTSLNWGQRQMRPRMVRTRSKSLSRCLCFDWNDMEWKLWFLFFHVFSRALFWSNNWSNKAKNIQKQRSMFLLSQMFHITSARPEQIDHHLTCHTNERWEGWLKFEEGLRPRVRESGKGILLPPWL